MNEEIIEYNEKAKSLEEIAQKIKDSPNVDDELIQMFNSSLMKKNLVRISKYDQILDCITDEIYNRLTNPDDSTIFGNRMLLDYLDTIQKLANNASEAKQVDINAIPKIQYNNQINVLVNDPVNSLDRESKEKVIDVIKSILKDAENEVIVDGDQKS